MRRRRPNLLTGTGLLCAVLGALLGAGTLAMGSVAAAATTGGSAVTVSKTVTRSQVVSGQNVVVDSNNVTLHVSQTSELEGRQEIAVSWTGAHPTGAIVADQNSSQAEYEEYPFVLLECRGVDSTSAAPDQRLNPQTCWTQASTERYQSSLGDRYPPYRLDQYATNPGASEVGEPSQLLLPSGPSRGAWSSTKTYKKNDWVTDDGTIYGALQTIAKSPTNKPPATDSGRWQPITAIRTSCAVQGSAPVQYWVPWDAANGKVYDGGALGCAGEPPEANNVGGSALPSNETFGVTGSGGTGNTNFDVWTSAQNQTLGCSATVPCSLVAVPIMGISCNPAPAGVTPLPSATQVSQCETTGTYPAGSGYTPNQNPGTVRDVSVTGALWWSPSNWRNRITVPLTFAPAANLCNVTQSAGNNVVQVFGSELMIQATTQWEPHFCTSTSDRFSFVHVQTGEPEARNLLANGNVDAAFTSDAQPGGYGKPVVNAPVALSGFAISYSIDGSDGLPYASLKLTPLLLAKLLTESYPGDSFVQQEDPALAHNPLNITQDPQFIALNPGISEIRISGTLSEAASELVAMSSDSDVMQALTTYINDDPVARAWLDGTPDQWGMVVNPAYKGIALPVDQWPLQSTFEPTTYYEADGGQLNNCLFSEPVPYQPLVAAPLANLEDISQAIQFSQPNSTTTCTQPIQGSSAGEKLSAAKRQSPGFRFLIGITPIPDAQRYLLQTASLETTTGTYVAPSETALKSAASLLVPDQTTGTWPIPYQAFRTAAGATAYPGTMVVYAAVPTSGLTSTDAKDYAELLKFAASTGQIQGPGVGQLPPGYLPLTAADGLGALASYTMAAATDVAAQSGKVPSLVAGTAAASGSSAPAAGAGGSAGGGATGSAAGSSTSGAYEPVAGHLFAATAARAESGGSSTPKDTSQKRRAVVSPPLLFDPTADVQLWIGGLPAPLVFGTALLGVVAVPLLYRVGRKRKRW